MDTNIINPTSTSESLSTCSTLQESHTLETQHANMDTDKSILPVNASTVSVNCTHDQINSHGTMSVLSDPPVTTTVTTTTIPNATSAVLNLPPPTPNLGVTCSSSDVTILSCLLPAPSSFTNESLRAISTPPPSLDPAPALITPAPCASDFDSDTELSIVAAAATSTNAAPCMVNHSTTSPVSSSSTIPCVPVQTELLTSTTNGHINSSNSNSSQISLNSKQQRQQKRRRERAQRLQAERDSRCNLSALSSTLIGGSVVVGATLGISSSTGGSSGGIIGSVPAPTILMSNSGTLGPGNNVLYHLNSAGSMGEDSNNSNGNFTSSSNGSNNLLPPTDSIASLLLNPPHSPECNSGLMATPSDSEGESLDEDLLSTSSSSTLLLPRDKPPPRPPPPVRRKLPRSPVLEEEIIDGFAILEFKTYEDLEFAIKLGQKRKEKRLSALEELTCTYSIEEMKMPKIIDTAQHLPLRSTNLTNMSIVNNNNLKENSHHRAVGVCIGATTNSINTNNNNNTTNNNNSHTVYTVPLPSICNAPDTEAENWIGDQFRQQEDQLSGNARNIGISINSNANQINNSQNLIHITKSKETEPSVTTESSGVLQDTFNTGASNCQLENGSEKLAAGVVVSHADLSNLNSNGNGSNNGTSQNCTNNANQPCSEVAEYKCINSTKLTDAIAVNNRLGGLLSGSSYQKVTKVNSVESEADKVATAAVASGLSLEIQDFTNGSANIVESTILLKQDNDLNKSLPDISNHCSSNKKELNICDKSTGGNKNSENLITFVFPSTIQVSNDSHKQTSSRSSTEYSQPQTGRKQCVTSNLFESNMLPLKVVSTPDLSSASKSLTSSEINGPLIVVSEKIGECANIKTIVGMISPAISTDPVSVITDDQQPNTATDNLLHTKPLHPPAMPAQVTSANISDSSEPYMNIETGNCELGPNSSANAQEISSSTKVIASQAKETHVLRPTIPSSSSVSPVTIAPLHSNSFGERAASVLPTANLKSNDNTMLSIHRDVLTLPVDSQKNTTGSVPTPPTANGFLTVSFPSVTCATTSNVLSRITPPSGNKVLPVPMTSAANTVVGSVAVAVSGIPKTSFSSGSTSVVPTGSSLVFHGATPPLPHLGAGLPMLIQAPPYRAPYPNYTLYTPYSSVGHGQYLPSVLPTGTPNTSCSPQRSDARNSRELQGTSSKAPVTSVLTSHQYSVSSIAGLRPITPLSYVISNTNTTQVVGTLATTTTSTVPSFNSTHANHLPAHGAGAIGVSTTVPTITTAQFSTPTGNSATAAAQAQPLAPMQIIPQSGYQSHLPKVLTSFPQFAPSTSGQQQTLLRCSTTSAMGTINTSVLTVQSLMTSMPSPSTNASIASPSSVIQKILSPKSENLSKDRDTSYSITTVRPNNSVPVSGGPPGITLGPSFCGLVPPVPYSALPASGSTTVSSATHSVLAVGGTGIAAYTSKTGLWLNPSLLQSPAMTCTPSTHIVNSGNARPSPSPLNSGAPGTPTRVTGNAISPHAVHSTNGSGHVPIAHFQPSLFATPHAPPHSSSAAPISLAAITSSSVGHLPLVPHTTAVIATMTTATTTTASVSTVGNTQSTVPTVSTAVTPTPHPFSAESLFQPNKNDQADLLRRELDSRFLDRSGLTQPPSSSSSTYLRQELHHHQHQHTHLHQHQQLLPAASISGTSTVLPPTPQTSTQIFPPPLFKDIPKISSVEPQFYRAGIGLPPSYTGYNAAGLLHSGLGGPTPFMPPNHLTSFAPKKTGRWNAMHVRIAWEIYYHQNKQNSEKPVAVIGSSLTNTSSIVNSVTSCSTGNTLSISSASTGGGVQMTANNIATSATSGSVLASAPPGIKPSSSLTLSSSSPHLLHRSSELTVAATFARSSFEASPLATSFIGAPPSHIGTAVSPFGRFVGSFGFAGLTHYGRDVSIGGHLDTWRTNAAPRSMPYLSAASGPGGWPIKTDLTLENARREAEEREREIREREQRERDRQRREREERERKEKEEKLKREQQERERERERERKERERREIERREIERERLIQQQRINESNKQAVAAASSSSSRDRSPHRSIGDHNTDIRIKEEHPRTKEEQDVMLLRASAAAGVGDPRYHSPSLVTVQATAAVAAAHHHANFLVTGRHGLPPPASHLSRNMMPPTLGVSGPLTHYAPPGPPGWGIDPYRDPYAPILRYNPLMEAAFRHEAEERQKALSMYAAQSAAHLRGKEPSPIPPPSVGALGSPATLLRMQPSLGVNITSSSTPSPSQVAQNQLGTIGIGKGAPPPAMNMTVQHMITGDSLSHPSVTPKKESEHTMGMVVSAQSANVSHSTVPGSIMTIPSVPPITPSR